jgi:regulator of sirC expression with transglutaminase-like and TPR domain
MMLDDPQGALDDLDRAVRVDANSARAFAARGLLRARLGDRAGAQADLARAERLNPSVVRQLAGQFGEKGN